MYGTRSGCPAVKIDEVEQIAERLGERDRRIADSREKWERKGSDERMQQGRHLAKRHNVQEILRKRRDFVVCNMQVTWSNM